MEIKIMDIDGMHVFHIGKASGDNVLVDANRRIACKAQAWEKRCEELEQENRQLKQDIDELKKLYDYCDKSRTKLVDELTGKEKENRKLKEQIELQDKGIIDLTDENRELRERLEKVRQDRHDLNNDIVAWKTTVGSLDRTIKELRDRIADQDLTIAKYDDENRRLRETNADSAKDVLYYKNIAEQYKYERDLIDEQMRNLPFKDGLNDWAKRIHDNAVEHGWWDEERSFGDIVALCHSELSEALEEYRNGKPMSYEGENGKPEGVAVEMIDCIIRILDWCGKEGINVDKILSEKHDYNKHRPYRHGGKKL